MLDAERAESANSGTEHGQRAAAAIGLTRERLEAAYDYLMNNPLIGLAVQRYGDELRLVSGAADGGAVHCCTAGASDRCLSPAGQPGRHRERGR
jgi:hypothetical protein